MFLEGKGKAAPCPHRVDIDDYELRVLMKWAVEIAAYRDYSRKQTQWQRGLTGRSLSRFGLTISGPSYGILMGKTGEYGYATFLDLPLDLEVRPFGDGDVDLNPGNMPIQVKTRGGGSDSLIRRVNDYGKLLPFTCDVLAFAQWSGGNQIDLIGWILARRAQQLCEFGKARVGKHFNLIIPDCELEPVSDLRTLIKGR